VLQGLDSKRGIAHDLHTCYLHNSGLEIIYRRPGLRIPEKFFRGVAVGAITGTAVGLGGFFLATRPSTAGMGMAMFIVVPFSAGFAIGVVTPGSGSAKAAMTLSVIACLLILVASGREGLLCAILAFPIVGACMVAGLGLAIMFRKYVLPHFRSSGAPTGMVLAVIPLVVVVGHRLELPALELTRYEMVSTSIRLHATPEQVWANIQSVDTIDVSKPWLMHIGLPVPVSCAISRTGLGAKRTCYFENGSIEETVTEWAPPHLLRLSIDRTRMPGRHWLGFQSAFYEISRDGDETVLTRTTSITSHLYPIWYWRYFERLGVASEHDYILRNVQRRLQESTIGNSSATPST